MLWPQRWAVIITHAWATPSRESGRRWVDALNCESVSQYLKCKLLCDTLAAFHSHLLAVWVQSAPQTEASWGRRGSKQRRLVVFQPSATLQWWTAEEEGNAFLKLSTKNTSRDELFSDNNAEENTDLSSLWQRCKQHYTNYTPLNTRLAPSMDGFLTSFISHHFLPTHTHEILFFHLLFTTLCVCVM